MTAQLHIKAPTDAQLAYIHDLAEKYGVIEPSVIASKQEASRIITDIKTGDYWAEDYEWPWEVSFR